MHKQIQIAPGVYITDFRKDKNLIGLGEQKTQLTNDVSLLLEQAQGYEDKINQLQYSIKEIESQQNWQQDADFVQAIQENWEYIVKFSYSMKERVLRLFQLHYHPQSEKIQDLLKITRIEERQERAVKHVKDNILKFRKKLQNKKEGPTGKAATVNDDEDSGSEKEGKAKPQQKQEGGDEGVYI